MFRNPTHPVSPQEASSKGLEAQLPLLGIKVLQQSTYLPEERRAKISRPWGEEALYWTASQRHAVPRENPHDVSEANRGWGVRCLHNSRSLVQLQAPAVGHTPESTLRQMARPEFTSGPCRRTILPQVGLLPPALRLVLTVVSLLFNNSGQRRLVTRHNYSSIRHANVENLVSFGTFVAAE